MDNLANRLQKQASIAREENASTTSQSLIRQVSPSALSTGFDAEVGLDRVVMSDGSVAYAATDTNGVRGQSAHILALISTDNISIDTLPVTKRPSTPRVPIQVEKPYPFWLLMGEYLHRVEVLGNKATVKILTKGTDYPHPDDYLDIGEMGVARISDTKFYQPTDDAIRIFDISSLTVSRLVIIETPGNRAQAFSCCSLPSGDFFAEVHYAYFEPQTIIHISPSGAVTNIPCDTYLNDGWSIAATNPTTLYRAIDYQGLVKHNLVTGSREVIFNTFLGGFIPLLGYYIDEITSIFADISNGDVYTIAIVDNDSQVPGLQHRYTVPNISFVGVASELDRFSRPCHILTGSFPPGVTCPGDRISVQNTGSTNISRIINDTTVLVDAGSGFILGEVYPSAELFTGDRHLRTLIFKTDATGNTSIYYKFPGIDNRISADGYRYFYNLPSSAAFINPKNKDIYMAGQRSFIVKDGKYLGDGEGFNDKNIVKITGRTKKLIPLELKWDASVSAADRAGAESDWYFWGKLHPIYKFT